MTPIGAGRLSCRRDGTAAWNNTSDATGSDSPGRIARYNADTCVCGFFAFAEVVSFQLSPFMSHFAKKEKWTKNEDCGERKGRKKMVFIIFLKKIQTKKKNIFKPAGLLQNQIGGRN
jgi:hypothetical protein